MLLSTQEQDALVEGLERHAAALFRLPCARFDNGYPFAWPRGARAVSFTAVVEHFGEGQLHALIRSLNRYLQRGTGRVPTQQPLPRLLKATALPGGDGIQLLADEPTQTQQLLDELGGRYGDSYDAFVAGARVRVALNVPFGDAETARLVTLEADAAVPLFVMLRLVHSFGDAGLMAECGLGMVVVSDRSGLPRAREADPGAFFLHFILGLVPSSPS